jgi:hypothetical protein
LTIDVARTGDFPQRAHLPKSLKKLTLQYPQGGYSEKDYVQRLFSSIQSTGKGNSLVVRIARLGGGEDDQELGALNRKLEDLRSECD